MPPLWFGYGWSTKRSCRALAGSASRAVRPVPHDPRVAVPVRVVDDELAARRIVGREREPEQPLLPARRDEPADVEERLGSNLAALDDPDEARLLDDVELIPRAAGWHDDLKRILRARPRP